MSRPDLIGIKVLTIKQPYAGLIAAGFKRFETRSWSTTHRGDLLIHAGKQTDEAALARYEQHAFPEWVKEWIAPQGVLLCKVTLVNCLAQDTLEWDQVANEQTERDFGYWHAGHYAWQLSDPTAIERIPSKGLLGLWTLK